tara:strand:+ start:3174 stop:3602 length:429 start_codon:yes stop_codon:yes gene_type:complete
MVSLPGGWLAAAAGLPNILQEISMNVRTLARKLNTWQSILGFLTVVIGLYAAAPAIGLELPRFAWVSEVEASEEKIEQLHLRMERLHLNGLNMQWNDIVSRIAELEARSIVVPSKLSIMEELLRDEMINQRDYIREIQGGIR